MSWSETETTPSTTWSTTSQVSPNTSYDTSTTAPDLTWKHFAYLLWKENNNRIWGQVDYQWGSE